MNEKKVRIVIVIVLFASIIGFSIGFASFSKNLTVATKSGVTANPNNFKVVLSTMSNRIKTGSITPSVSAITSATPATITNASDKSTISGMSITFDDVEEGYTGLSATYTFYVKNAGKYTAYLNSVIFNNVSGQTSSKVCTPLPGATQSGIANACSGIRLYLKIGDTIITDTSSAIPISNANINGHSLASSGNEKVILGIYLSNWQEADGDYKVEFGDIDIVYSSAD